MHSFKNDIYVSCIYEFYQFSETYINKFSLNLAKGDNLQSPIANNITPTYYFNYAVEAQKGKIMIYGIIDGHQLTVIP